MWGLSHFSICSYYIDIYNWLFFYIPECDMLRLVLAKCVNLVKHCISHWYLLPTVPYDFLSCCQNHKVITALLVATWSQTNITLCYSFLVAVGCLILMHLTVLSILQSYMLFVIQVFSVQNTLRIIVIDTPALVENQFNILPILIISWIFINFFILWKGMLCLISLIFSFAYLILHFILGTCSLALIKFTLSLPGIS